MHPDHDTLKSFRQNFLEEIKEVFVQVLLYAQEQGHLKLGAISLDGSKIQAGASKHGLAEKPRDVPICPDGCCTGERPVQLY